MTGNRFGTVALAAVVMCALSAGNARAFDAALHTLNFEDAAIAEGAGGLGLSNPTDGVRWEYTFDAMAVFNTGVEGALPSVGDTFREVVVIRVNQFLDPDVNNLLAGTGYGSTHELTSVIDIQGSVVDFAAPGLFTFQLSDLNRFDIFFDAEGTTPLTLSNFADYETFTDGTLVLSGGDLLSGAGTQLTTPGFTGSLDMINVMLDELGAPVPPPDQFILDVKDPDTLDPVLGDFQLTFASADPVLAPLTAARRNSLAALFAGVSVGDPGAFDFGTVVAGDPPGRYTGPAGAGQTVFFVEGSGELRVTQTGIIPEPTTAALGLIGIAGAGLTLIRRRRQAA